jgi:hypothetical protein
MKTKAAAAASKRNFIIEPSAQEGRYTIVAQIRYKRDASITLARLERIDAPAPRIGEVANVRAKPEAYACAHRRKRHVVAPLIIHANAANEVGRAVNASIAMEDIVSPAQIVCEREHARGVAASVEPN